MNAPIPPSQATPADAAAWHRCRERHYRDTLERFASDPALGRAGLQIAAVAAQAAKHHRETARRLEEMAADPGGFWVRVG